MTTKRFNFPSTVPLRYDGDGNIRVTGSRITLDTVVTCFEMGDTPEDILDGYPSLTLEQINAIRAWYLSNRAEADVYIREGREEAEKLRQEIESWPENIAFKEKMRSLREQLNKS
jgi:uncharacterized protein (DUF433 family)